MISDVVKEIGSLIVELLRKSETWVILFIVGFGAAFFFSTFSFEGGVGAISGKITAFLELTWWLWLFPILFIPTHSLFVYWRNEKYIHSNEMKMVLMELKIPLSIAKSPKAMEQVLSAMHDLRNVQGDPGEKYIDGEVTRWFSLEIVSFGGEVHYYIRSYYKQRHLVQAAFFSYYPDIEIVEVSDYMDKVPRTPAELREQGKDLWGAEMLLAREGVYPIKSYKDFEHEAEEKNFDPMSTFIEMLAKLDKSQFVGIQILIAPMADDWNAEFKHVVEKLKANESEKRTKEGYPLFKFRTPGETNVLEAVENNLSKKAFETVIRFIYVSPKETFYDSFPRRGIKAGFNQYGNFDLNWFKINYAIGTRTKFWNFPYVFPKKRNVYKIARILHNYIHREWPPHEWIGRFVSSFFLNWNFESYPLILNIESLATIFHPPTAVVTTAPHVPRIESRKQGPPAGLAIFGDEEDIEKYKEQ